MRTWGLSWKVAPGNRVLVTWEKVRKSTMDTASFSTLSPNTSEYSNGLQFSSGDLHTRTQHRPAHA